MSPLQPLRDEQAPPVIPAGFVTPEPSVPTLPSPRRHLVNRLLPVLSLIATVVGLGGIALIGHSAAGAPASGTSLWAILLTLLGGVGLCYLVLVVGVALILGPPVGPVATARRFESVIGSGPPIAHARGSGRLGRFSTGPGLWVWVYPAGMIVRIWPIAPKAILATEVRAARLDVGGLAWLRQPRLTIDHDGVELFSPTIFAGAGAAVLAAALARLPVRSDG